MHEIDDPAFQDNRNYNYSQTKNVERPEYSIITELVEKNSSVIEYSGRSTFLVWE